MDTIGLWQITEDAPTRLNHLEVTAERDLEAWIERDPALLERGLRIVGRQLRLEAGPLDLLALDPQGRWVLIEIKKERLRRDVVAQAIDYASCLHRRDTGQLRQECDTYLRSRGGTETLDMILAKCGRTLDDEKDGREVIIYLVGTGFDAGLERMLAYLEERAELAIRMVTFSTFRDQDGRMLLAREIHESILAPSTPKRAVTPAPAVTTVLALADENGVGSATRALYGAATELGLHVRPWPKSLMFAPPANRTRCLFVVWVERRQKEPGVAKAYIGAEAFEQFYGITEADLIQAVGQVGYVTLDGAAATRVGDGLRRVMAGVT